MVFEDTLETAGSEYTPTVCYKNTQTAMLSLWLGVHQSNI